MSGGRVLVEASPQDRIWGIGLAAGDQRATSPQQWPGLNLLGFALMEVRQQLRSGLSERAMAPPSANPRFRACGPRRREARIGLWRLL
jgi:hypothetical protein